MSDLFPSYAFRPLTQPDTFVRVYDETRPHNHPFEPGFYALAFEVTGVNEYGETLADTIAPMLGPYPTAIAAEHAANMQIRAFQLSRIKEAA